MRVIESGGAAGDIGGYVTLRKEDGHASRVPATGGGHRRERPLASVLVRANTLRRMQIRVVHHRHALREIRQRQSAELRGPGFCSGLHGRPEPDLPGKDKAKTSAGLPVYVFIIRRGSGYIGTPNARGSCVGNTVTAVALTILTMFVRNPTHQHHAATLDAEANVSCQPGAYRTYGQPEKAQSFLHPQRAVPRWPDQGKEIRCGGGSKNTR